MADPDVSSEPGKFQEVAKAAAELQKAVDGHAAYRELEQQLEEARAMLKESQGEPAPPWHPNRRMQNVCRLPHLELLAHLRRRRRARSDAH